MKKVKVEFWSKLLEKKVVKDFFNVHDAYIFAKQVNGILIG